MGVLETAPDSVGGHQTGPDGSAALTLDDGVLAVRFSAGQSPYDVSAVRKCVCFTGCTGVSNDARFFCLTSETALRVER